MKITKEHLESLVFLIGRVDREKIKQHEKTVIESGKFKDLKTRMRWDILRAALPANWVCDNLYPYLNDQHIDSALKHALKECGLSQYV